MDLGDRENVAANASIAALYLVDHYPRDRTPVSPFDQADVDERHNFSFGSESSVLRTNAAPPC
jgi:hypothetical protein